MESDGQISCGTPSQLDDVEREILQAYQPSLATTPDIAAAQRNLAAVYAKHQTSELAVYCLVETDIKLGLLSDAGTTMAAFLARNDTFATGWYLRGQTLVLSGDVPNAEAAYRKCLEASPGASDCLTDKAILDENEGNCTEAEELSRGWLNVDPSSPRAYRSLACSIYARGGSLEAALAMVAKSIEASQPERREYQKAIWAMRTNLLHGDFAEALQYSKVAENALAPEPDEEVHEIDALDRMQIYAELGDEKEVDRIARAFEKDRDLWAKSDFLDYEIVPWSFRYRVGAVSRADFLHHREAWLNVQATRKPTVDGAGYRWIVAYAFAVASDEDGREAIRALPSSRPLIDPLRYRLPLQAFLSSRSLRRREASA
jgi:tetratricopeptide (TPR) repeat protein